jgi:hypothetical protein
MNKLVLSLSLLIAVASCKGPGSGPLAKDSSGNTENSHSFHKGMTSQSPNAINPAVKMNITVEPCKDCIKISDLLENRKNYSGKTITVTGQVTKFNPQIMGKNWIHIQDGSEFQGAFDLTITTDQEVRVGDTITFAGKIVLDKDFGHGYFYSILMEEGKPSTNL